MTKKRKYIIIIALLIVITLSLIFTRVKIENNINENNVKEKYNIYVVYSPTCPHCENLLNFLEEERIGVEKIPIENFYTMDIFNNLSKYFNGVPFVFANVNGTIIIIEGYPSKDEENNGYFIGKEFEENFCIKANGTPIYINNTYGFCELSKNVFLGNEYAILWLIEQCKKYGCKKLE